MDLKALRKPDLESICLEMGIDIAGLKRKPLIMDAIHRSGADGNELQECWEFIQEREKKKNKRKKENAWKKRKMKRGYAWKNEKAQKESQERAIEKARIDLELARTIGTPSSVGQQGWKMKNFLQPYRVGRDIGLLLVNFAKACEKASFSRESWPQRLLTLLPCEAAGVVARLSREDSEDYTKVKSGILEKYRLFADAFRKRFREVNKKTSESYPEFAYSLKSNLEEWLKGSEVFGDHDKVVECVCLEQVFSALPEETRYWVQDRLDVKTVQRAVELAEEFSSRRGVLPEGRGRQHRDPSKGAGAGFKDRLR
ncbi:unnamed protein product, partial [Ixodes pacificus]